MTRFLKGIIAVACVAVIAVNAQATTILINANVAGAFDSAFNPIPIPDLGTNVGFPAVYQIDLSVSVPEVSAGQAGFANAGMNIGLNGLTDVAGWGPDTRTVDSNGAAPGGIVPLWATNVDGGTPGDLQGVLVSIAGGVTATVDPRRKVGQPGGLDGYFGSIFVEWNGQSYATLDVKDILTSANTTTGQFVDNGSAPSVQLTFGSTGPNIPEPTSLVLMGSCFAGLLLRRRG